MLGDVQERLRDIGLIADLEAARLSRVDLFRNVRAESQFIDYRPTLDLLTMVRAAESRNFGASYLWLNSRRQLAVYDKRAELAAKHQKAKRAGNLEAVELLDRAAAELDGNVFRFEMRLLRPSAIRAGLKAETWGGLLSKWDTLPGAYADFWRSCYFRREPAEFELLDGLRDVATVDGLFALLMECARRNGDGRPKIASGPVCGGFSGPGNPVDRRPSALIRYGFQPDFLADYQRSIFFWALRPRGTEKSPGARAGRWGGGRISGPALPVDRG